MPTQCKNRMAETLVRERMTKTICSELNNFVELDSVIEHILLSIRAISKCGEVAIWIDYEDDYFCYQLKAGNKEVVKSINISWCKCFSQALKQNMDHTKCRTSCICNKVLNADIDYESQYFTGKGSFWINNAQDYFSVQSANVSKDEKTESDNCLADTLGSVTVVPLKSKGMIIGLIKLTDKNDGYFNKDIIEWLEMIAENIGLSITSHIQYEQLLRIHENLNALEGIIPICSSCKKIRDKNDFWHSIESYITRHSDASFTHCICPDCYQQYYASTIAELKADQLAKLKSYNNDTKKK